MLVSAVNEERLNRKKLFWGWPERSVPEALRLAGVGPRDVDLVAVAGTSGSAKEFGDKGYNDLGFARERLGDLQDALLAYVEAEGLSDGREGYARNRRRVQQALY